MNNNYWFQFSSQIKHYLRAWNTAGEGIHSPRLFYLARHIFYETAQLYSWQTIEKRRQAMLRARKIVHIRDYGTGYDRDELVMSIAKHSVMERKYAQLLARVLHYMSGREYVLGRTRGLNILELGTSLGLTTAYLAAIDSNNQIVTFEGSEEVAAIASLNWEKIHVQNIKQVIGPIDDTLYLYARDGQIRLDYVLMDANHTSDATLRYFEWLLPCMDSDGVLVVDDIRYSRDMYSAWETITKHRGVTATMDLGRMGLVFFYPHVQQRTYLLRI